MIIISLSSGVGFSFWLPRPIWFVCIYSPMAVLFCYPRMTLNLHDVLLNCVCCFSFFFFFFLLNEFCPFSDFFIYPGVSAPSTSLVSCLCSSHMFVLLSGLPRSVPPCRIPSTFLYDPFVHWRVPVDSSGPFLISFWCLMFSWAFLWVLFLYSFQLFVTPNGSFLSAPSWKTDLFL